MLGCPPGWWSVGAQIFATRSPLQRGNATQTRGVTSHRAAHAAGHPRRVSHRGGSSRTVVDLKRRDGADQGRAEAAPGR